MASQQQNYTAQRMLNTPAPTLVHGLRALAHAIHPDLFPTAEGIRRVQASVF
jgi:hypothetical protein